MSLHDYAKRELWLTDWCDSPTALALLSVVDVFASEGHSGGSAAIAGPMMAENVRRLLAFEPLTPLTGEDSEWTQLTEKMMGRPGVEQNKRCSRIFRENGVAYDIEAVVFCDWNGEPSFTGWDSARIIEFPYSPVTRYTRFRFLSRLWARVTHKLPKR